MRFTLLVLASSFLPSVDAFAHADAPRQRRVRYAGKYPKRFEEKHKEQAGDEATIARVLLKGGTPAGSHVPIMPTECLTHLGLIEGQTEITTAAPSAGGLIGSKLVAVDCTLGFGGHSGLMLDALSRWVATSSANSAVLASFDQDGIELAKTEARLRARPSFSSESAALSLDCIHANFATVGDAFALRQLPKAHALLADLGCSSMQIDDPARGFTWKAEGPLDMRMDSASSASVTAAELLVHSNVTSLAALLHAHSDFDMADARALALAILGAPVPATTSALAAKVRSVKPPVPVVEASPVDASGRPHDVRVPGGGKGSGGKGDGGKGGVVGGRGGSLKGMPRERDGGLRAVEHARRLRALGTKRLLLELDEDDETEARAAARASAGKPKPLSAEVSAEEAEKELNSRVARVMQALRVEVNAEFAALDSLLASLPSVLAPSGRAVFLTFHSGEDRRVKQAMKEGLKAGDYSEVSRRVVRVGSAEARANPRSKCCKLRWCVRAAN